MRILRLRARVARVGGAVSGHEGFAKHGVSVLDRGVVFFALGVLDGVCVLLACVEEIGL